MPDKKKLVSSLGMILGAICDVVFGMTFGSAYGRLPRNAGKPPDAR